MAPLKHQFKQYTRRSLKHLWDHLVPHDGNSHQPHVLKHRVLVGYSVLLVLLKALAIVAPVALPSSSLYSSAITPTNIVDLTNQTRINLSLVELSVSDQLMQAAAAKAEDMVGSQYFAHVSPTGVTPWSWMVEVGYKYKYAGENLAVHFTSAEGVQEGWLASPSHRANIVNKNYSEIGVGVAMGEFEGFPTTFVVQMFGTPVGAVPVVTAVTVPPATTTQVQPPLAIPPATQPEVASAEEPVSPPAPVITTEPEPAAPVTVPELVTGSASATAKIIPTLDASSVVIIQQDGYYDVRLSLAQADTVAAYLGTSWVPLTRAVEQTNVWSGQVPFDKLLLNQNGEQLSVVATSADNNTARFALAWVAPQTKTQNFYTFNEGSDRYARLFGFLTIHNLQDSVRQFYFFFIVFLAAALIINILVKIRVQKLSVIGHTVFVLAFTMLLMTI